MFYYGIITIDVIGMAIFFPCSEYKKKYSMCRYQYGLISDVYVYGVVLQGCVQCVMVVNGICVHCEVRSMLGRGL